MRLCSQCRTEPAKANGKCTRCNTEYARRRRARARRLIVDYLRAHPCVDCGERDVDVLEFDHIEPVGSRALRIADMMQLSMRRIMAEIDLCQVRCANCHTRRTRQQLGTSRYGLRSA